jgi:hypothetical protein
VDLQKAFCENFTGIITHPITHVELKGFKQKVGCWHFLTQSPSKEVLSPSPAMTPKMLVGIS